MATFLLHRPMVSPVMTPNDLRGEWEERAAILEYDAGMPRHAAEARATQLLADRYGMAVGRVLAFLVAASRSVPPFKLIHASQPPPAQPSLYPSQNVQNLDNEREV